MVLVLVMVKMMHRIAILIMMYGTGYVASIRNGGSVGGSIGVTNDNYGSSDTAESMSSSNFFPSEPLKMMRELLQPAARQGEPSFRPSQIIEFTPQDATTNSQQGPQFIYPASQQQQQQPSMLFNSNNYNTNTQSNKLNTDIPTKLQSTPILTYRDPYTNENYYHTPSPAVNSPTQRQEFTVHSSMMVHNQRYDAPSSSSTTFNFPPQSYASTPAASFETSYYPQVSHKYDTPSHYSQRPNALPSAGFDRETTVASKAPMPPKSISYDSKDYPPPSYYQTSNYLPPPHPPSPTLPPQRQEFSSTSSLAPNYAHNNNNNNNNYNLGNYLQGEQYPQIQQQTLQQQLLQQQKQQALQIQSGNYNSRLPSYTSTQYPPPSFVRPQPQYHTPQYQPSRGGPPPSYNSYYGYQQGEIPPPGYPPRPPYRPSSSYPSQQSSGLPDGLASLASLFTATQQYAPQFSNLLFGGGGGGGGGGGSSNSPLGSLLGAFAGGNGGGATATRPVNMQLIKALENIARNDDLQCVPKVLCQMIAGQTQRGQLPDFLTSPAITNFLSAFPASSPALIYGRAALLGISGGIRSCVQTYAQCPKNEDEILYYLNNHRGGFFKFFSEPEPEMQKPQQSAVAADESNSSLFSILSLLTGNPVAPKPTTTPRPRPRPTAAASADISNGIGNFFTNVLSNYLGGVEYQRRRRRRRSATDSVNPSDDVDDDDDGKEIEQDDEVTNGFHDEEDDEDTQQGDDGENEPKTQYVGIEGRILNQEITALGAKATSFFPDTEAAAKIRQRFVIFNKAAASRKLKFPSVDDDVAAKLKQRHRGGKEINFKDIRDFDAPSEGQHVNFIDDEAKEADEVAYEKQRGKVVRFRDDDTTAMQDIMVEVGNVRFPDRYEELIRKGRILNRPAYAGGYAEYVRNQDDDREKFVLSNTKRTPHYQSSSFQNSNQQAANSAYLSNSNGSGYYIRPSKDSYPRYEYPNNNYDGNNRYGGNYQQSGTSTTHPHPYEDDKNVYVTNSKGMTEYYITPDGRKVYL